MKQSKFQDKENSKDTKSKQNTQIHLKHPDIFKGILIRIIVDFPAETFRLEGKGMTYSKFRKRQNKTKCYQTRIPYPAKLSIRKEEGIKTPRKTKTEIIHLYHIILIKGA